MSSRGEASGSECSPDELSSPVMDYATRKRRILKLLLGYAVLLGLGYSVTASLTPALAIFKK